MPGLVTGEPGGTGQWQEIGPNPGLQEALWALAIDMHYCGCKILPSVHTQQWRPLWGIRLTVCKYKVDELALTAHMVVESFARIKAGILHLHSSRGLSWLPVWVPGAGGGWGTEGAGRNSGSWHQWAWVPVDWKPGKSAGGPQQLCWPLVSSVAKGAGSSAEWVTGNFGCFHCAAAIGSPCFSSLFLAGLYTLQLCQSGWGEIKVGAVPQKAGEAYHSPYFPFSGEGNSFLLGSSLRALRDAGLGDGMMQAKGSCLLLFLCGYSRGFSPIVLLKFLKWTPELSQSCFYFWAAVCWFLLGTEAGVSYSAIWVMSPLSPSLLSWEPRWSSLAGIPFTLS